MICSLLPLKIKLSKCLHRQTVEEPEIATVNKEATRRKLIVDTGSDQDEQGGQENKDFVGSDYEVDKGDDDMFDSCVDNNVDDGNVNSKSVHK